MEKGLIAICLLWCISTANASVSFYESTDEFGDGEKLTMAITDSGNKTTLFASCSPNGALSVQLNKKRVIHPNGVRDKGGMNASITYKFDKAKKSVTGNWYMGMMRYKNAWLIMDKMQFIQMLGKSSKLSLRLNKTNDIHRYELKGTSKHVSKILTTCSRLAGGISPK